MQGFRRIALALCGGGLFVWLIIQIGPEPILRSLSRLSWRLIVLLFFPCVLFKTFDTLSWYFAFPVDRVAFLTLAKTRLVGQAINVVIPTGTLGGDAAKAWLLRDEVSLQESLSSLIIAKTTMTASQGIFLLVGVLVARRVAPDAAVIRAMEVLLVLEVFAVGGFVVAQMAGAFSRGHRLLGRFGLLRSSHFGQAASEIDQALSTFYRRRPDRLALSVGFALLGWFASAAEVWTILAFLGAAVPVETALVVEAFGSGIRFATFFVPAQIGFVEGGAVATFLALGLDSATGLSFSLVRRLREALWIGVGLLLAGTPMRAGLTVRPSGP